MSDETQANPLFAPFMPPNEQTMTFTEAPAAPGKRLRKPRTAKTQTTSPVAAHGTRLKTKRKPKPPKQSVSPEHPRPKFDLQTILRAAAVLKDDDYPAFEPLLNTFNDMAKPQRERILLAIGRVFA